jgi:enoyl-CoA hydratase
MSQAYVDYLVEDGIAIVTVDHPPVNALNEATWKKIGEIYEDLNKRDDVKVIIATGAGEKAFVAGADITELPALKSFSGRAYSVLCQESMDKVEYCEKVVIAAVNGLALGGGCEYMMACDIRIAADTARIGVPEINLGIIPGAGGTQRLPRIVPKGTAKLMIMTGDMIPAEEALRIGLVDKVVPLADLMTEAKTIAQKLAAKAPVALKQAKIAVNMGVNTTLREGLGWEAKCFGVLCGTEDKNEGVDAFLNKRKAEFKGE